MAKGLEKRKESRKKNAEETKNYNLKKIGIQYQTLNHILKENAKTQRLPILQPL